LGRNEKNYIDQFSMAFQFSSQIKHRLLLLCVFAVISSCASNVNSAEDKSLQSQTIIGIDLGTTYSCVGVFHQGRVEILANDQGNRITPSYVAFTSDGRRLIGDAAKNQATVNTENTIFDVKRFIGRGFDEKTVQDDRKMLPYELIDVNNKPYILIRNSASSETIKLAPEEVSAMILSKMKETAESFLGYPVHRAVVTVPAYFTDSQRHATRDAAVIAGLKVERILNEPTAAAIAFGMDKSNYREAKEETTVLVFDLGGGTFDVTVLLVDNGAFQVLATNGDTHLGGEDFDQRVMEYVVQQIKGKDSIDISKNKRALQKLRKEVERAKRALSNQYKARLEVDDLVPGYHLSETLTRAKFEELNLELFKKTLGPVRKVLEDALLEISEIDEIVMVGGSTRIPKVQQLIFEFFDGKEPNTKMNPDEAVAYGAAIQGSILGGQGGDAVKSVVLVDVTPLSLGTETKGGVMDVLIPRGSVIPTEKTSKSSSDICLTLILVH
jgi:endoplasmic reticulum chaperone BiP